jgi:hypothetical protein
LTKSPKSYDGEKNSLFNKCCWENWICACRKLKPDPCFSPFKSINSKGIKNLNIRNLAARTGKSREYCESNSKGKDFLSIAQVAQQLRGKMDKWDYMKLKSFSTKETVFKLKRPPTEREKIC